MAGGGRREQADLNGGCFLLEAALFAFRSPLSRGAILADEVGLGFGGQVPV